MVSRADPAARHGPVVRVDDVSRAFGETRAVDRVSIDVQRGELLVLLGPSGCGKTTTLRMIAGFETPDAGRILIEGRDVTREPPQRRSTGMVFQNYALFPHLDVYENVAFGLKARGTPKNEIAPRVRESLALVDLAGYEKRRVQQLSGGQQQRVALARAIAPRPPVLLLDEPLSNLDATLRERTRTELRALLKRLGMTAIFVTHDQDEAFALADRIAVMRAGRVEQLGTSRELYREPVSEFVANFLGHANLVSASVTRIQSADLSVLCALEGWGSRWWAAAHAEGAPAIGATVRLMIRPEDLELLRPGEAADVPAETYPGEPAEGRISACQFTGSHVRYTVEPPGGGARPLIATARDLGFEVGDFVSIAPRLDASVRWFPLEPVAHDA